MTTPQNPDPQNQKPNFPIWVWALIGSGGTLLIFLAGLGVWSLINSGSTSRVVNSSSKPPSPEQSAVSSSPLPGDFNNLKMLLSEGHLREADIETRTLLLKASGEKAKGTPINISTVPCNTLRDIDRLWLTYSGGRFGFSVQSRIWKEIRGTMPINSSNQAEHNKQVTDFWLVYGNRLGWFEKDGNSFLAKRYSNINFSLTAPEGHLPCGDIGCSTYLAFSGGLTEKFTSCGL